MQRMLVIASLLSTVGGAPLAQQVDDPQAGFTYAK
jgi:hypothetical protein